MKVYFASWCHQTFRKDSFAWGFDLAWNLLGLGWWSAVTVGVEAGVFLCALACDDAVAAVIEALMGFGCFFGEPLSVTVGPTDCERPTVKTEIFLIRNPRLFSVLLKLC